MYITTLNKSKGNKYLKKRTNTNINRTSKKGSFERQTEEEKKVALSDNKKKNHVSNNKSE